MKAAIRFVLMGAVITVGLAMTGASRAQAQQVSFYGTFPLPHGSVSIGIGNPAFAVGAYVPVGYPVYYAPSYGYGFAYGGYWIPARPYGSAWRVCARPYYGNAYYAGYPGGYYGGYYAPYYHGYSAYHGGPHGYHGHGGGHGHGHGGH